MSLGELLLTGFIAILVFGPAKLPMLARHLGKLLRFFSMLRHTAAEFWQKQSAILELQDNIEKAVKAEQQAMASSLHIPRAPDQTHIKDTAAGPK